MQAVSQGSRLNYNHITFRRFAKSLRASGPVQPMPVPSSYNDITANASIRDFVGSVWYSTNVYIPNIWQGQRTVLNFASVHYQADVRLFHPKGCIVVHANTFAMQVWVNGVHVVSHEGGHLPFEADITNVAVSGSNLIVVECNNTLFISSIPPGSLSTNTVGRVIQNLQMDFFNYAGIHREVRLYTTNPQTHVDDISATTSLNDATGAASVGLVIATSGADQVEVTLFDADNTIVATNVSAVANGVSTTVLTVANANLWWPWTMSATPGYLYTIQVVSLANSQKLDYYRLTYGLRTVKLSGTTILINGQQAYLTGFAGHHEDADVRGKALDLPMIVRDFNMMMWLGANSFRTSHYPYSETIMDMADRYGFIVVDESPAVGVQSQNQINATLSHHLMVEAELVRRDKNRPSTMIWSVANEPDSTCSTAATYFSTVMDFVRSLDSTRPVSFVTCQDYNNDKAVPFADIILINRYYGWYIQTGQLDTIQHDLMTDVSNWHNLYPSKPMMETEYGADTVAVRVHSILYMYPLQLKRLVCAFAGIA
jgi:beta-glucuronidase